MKNKQWIYISEYHISQDASPADAEEVLKLLQAEGWSVAYGDYPWKFDTDNQRQSFEEAFNWAWAVVTAVNQQSDEGGILDLARQRIQFNDHLQVHEEQLLGKRPYEADYLNWLIRTPTQEIITWLETIKQKDVSKG